ncbi:MAG: Fe-S cluster assembly protein HesB [Acidimicrobiia bacterium]|nr:Fe-S cluster assembly protein HesB [Acidimicrobiia bacterium]MBP8180431.1 Fe-S cluster assembly protein HesB [Acidimicrobiia bacterium]
MTVESLHFSNDPAANRRLAFDPMALMIGMLLDQQVAIEWAFLAPHTLANRMGLSNDQPISARTLASLSEEEVVNLFVTKPALHRYPAAMARRVHKLAQVIAQDYDGEPQRIWLDAPSGKDLFKALKALPGFGDKKARIFVGIVGKRLGAGPPGWEACAAEWGTVADADSPGSVAEIRMLRAHKDGPAIA